MSLGTNGFADKIIFRRNLSSTNLLARKLAVAGAEEGTVVVAKSQRAGRGRLGREWASPRGGLWFSIVLRPNISVAQSSGIVFVFSLAVAETLHGKYGLKARTKWPNDVLVGNKKICGILVETNSTGASINFSVVGVGLNANFRPESLPLPLRNVATSMEQELSRKVQLKKLLRAILDRVEKRYCQFLRQGISELLSEWKTYSGFLNHEVKVTDGSSSVHGLAVDVDEKGALILQLKDGTTKRVLVGDLFLSVDSSLINVPP